MYVHTYVRACVFVCVKSVCLYVGRSVWGCLRMYIRTHPLTHTTVNSRA